MRDDFRWRDFGNVYAYRDQNLAAMGFESYRAYQRSDLWKSIRERVLALNRFCQGCAKREAKQVHHRAYDPATLRGDDLRSLSAVCAGCHRKGEQPQNKRQHSSDRLERASYVSLRARKKAARKQGSLPRLVKP